jgi:Ion transport protein
VIETFKKSIL